MARLLGWLSGNTAALSILGAALAFVWSTIQQVSQRKHEAREHEFETYHRLVKELVSPDTSGAPMWLDRQGAVVFELRHFPRYYEFTERMLEGLKIKWSEDPNFRWPRLIERL